MREIRPSNQTGSLWLLGVVVGIGVFLGVASVVPGASCADGTQSSAIGRRGACSHHSGVTSGWTFLGVPAGLFAGVGTVALVESLMAGRASRRRDVVDKQWGPVGSPSTPASAESLVKRRGEDVQGFLRRVIAAGRWVAFQYPDEGTGQLRERAVRPRWLQLAEEAGERTLCLVGDCNVEGQRRFALSRMDRIRAVEPAPPA